jgi:hypothetical protein
VDARIELGLDPPTDLKKLPQRFQRYIGMLRDRIYTLERLVPSVDPTNIRIISRGRQEEVVYLPDGSHVHFNDIEVLLEPDGGIELRGERALVVRSRVSNVIAVQTELLR